MIEDRKAEHINIYMQQDVSSRHNFWDDVTLVHNAIPEINFDDIDTSVKLFGKKLNAPLIVSAITGGFKKAKDINENIARACADAGIGMGVGSQRAGIMDEQLVRTYDIVKDYDAPLKIGNIGAPQLIRQKEHPALTIDDIKKAFEMIDADIMAVHLNYLQEVVQPEGDTDAAGVTEAIKKLTSKFKILAKETGAGLSRKNIKTLKESGVAGIDVGGLSGTSFSAVEYFRAMNAGKSRKSAIGKLFREWGIPTPASVFYAGKDIPVIATGGIRNGLDAAKAISIGANTAGMAGAIVKPALSSYKSVLNFVENTKEELKTAMFLTGSGNIVELENIEYIITGELKPWFEL